MTNGRVARLRRENTDLRSQLSLLSELAVGDEPDEPLAPDEQIQADAIDIVSTVTALPWISHQRVRELSVAILEESSGALDVLDSGGSLDDYREREW